MKALATSKTIENFVNGSLIDRVAGTFIFGSERMGLSELESKRLQEVEMALDILDQVSGNQNIAIKKLQNHPQLKCSYTQAYNLLQDAKFVMPLIHDFDFSFELIIKKQRLEKAISACVDEKDFYTMAKLEEIHTKVIESMERLISKKKKPEKIVINLHMDLTRLGISADLYQEWTKELHETIIPSVKRKYKGYDIQDAEFESIS